MPTNKHSGGTMPWAAAILALLGFADSAFLTFKYYSGGIVPCSLTSCETVLTSSYSVIFGIPLALLGAAYYLTLVILVIISIDTGKSIWLRQAAWLTMFGFLFSLYLVGLQAFVLHAYCLYCLGSAGISTILCVLGQIILRKKYDH